MDSVTPLNHHWVIEQQNKQIEELTVITKQLVEIIRMLIFDKKAGRY